MLIFLYATRVGWKCTELYELFYGLILSSIISIADRSFIKVSLHSLCVWRFYELWVMKPCGKHSGNVSEWEHFVIWCLDRVTGLRPVDHSDDPEPDGDDAAKQNLQRVRPSVHQIKLTHYQQSPSTWQNTHTPTQSQILIIM